MQLIPNEPFLIDGWPDGYVEDHAWVAITPETVTPAQAIEYLNEQMPIEDADPIMADEARYYVVIGWSFQRRVGLEVEGTDRRVEHPLDQYGPCRTCKGRKKYTVIDKIELTHVGVEDAASRLASPWDPTRHIGMPLTEDREGIVVRAGGVITARHEEDCDDCYGTGKEADWIDGDEGWPYQPCGPDDEGAVLYWNLEVRDEPGPHDPVNKKVSDHQITLPGT